MRTTARNLELSWQVELTLAACRDSGLSVNRKHMRDLSGRMLHYHSIVYWIEPVIDPLGARPDTKNGAGFDADYHQADISGLAECLERYCLFEIKNRRPLVEAQEASGLGRLAEEDWPTFAPWQLQGDFPYSTYQIDAVKTWAVVEGLGVPPILVPASLVWQCPFEDRFMPLVSSGTACHSDFDQLLLTALYELVERDGFMIAWASRSSPPGISTDMTWLSSDVQEITRFCRRMGMSLKLRDLTTDLGIPTVLAMIEDDMGRRPALSIGAATRATLASAASKAAKEAYQCWCWMVDEHTRLTESYDAVFGKLRGKLEMMYHPLLYGFQKAVPFAEPLLKAPDRWTTENHGIAGRGRSDSDPREILAVCLSQLRNAGYSTYKVDLSPDELVFGGLHVMRILIPGLVPLGIGDRAYYMGHPRISTVPETCAWPRDRCDTESVPPPHPFP